MPKPIGRKRRRPLRRVGSTRLTQLLDKFQPAPEDWLIPLSDVEGLDPVECHDFDMLRYAWKRAMRWTGQLDNALWISLAAITSTDRAGDQLWFRMIANPGSGKTRICDALCVNKDWCHSLGQSKGFYSGWKGEGDEDYSLLSRINNKTLVTPEGDELLSSPMLSEILGQGRRIYDGTASASYRNRKEDRKYSGLRMTWILAGTSSLRKLNRSNLGDRFIDYVLDKPNRTVQQHILDRVAQTAIQNLGLKSDGKPETQLSPEMTNAYQLTGGMVGHLRQDCHELMARLDFPAEYALRCTKFGMFTGSLRARPPEDKEDSVDEDPVELPTRLTSQYIRLSGALSVVAGKDRVDEEVMSVVSKVAHDTCRGNTLSVLKHIVEYGPSTVKAMSKRLGRTDVTILKNLHFMKEIDLVKRDEGNTAKSGITGSVSNRWKLTLHSREILEGIGEITKKGK